MSGLNLHTDEVRRRAAGNWASILSSCTGIDTAILDGEHHPCPNCGGTDRFNADREKFTETGQVWCNKKCGLSGDAFHVIQTLLHVSFNEALEIVAQCLNLVSHDSVRSSGRPSQPVKGGNAVSAIQRKNAKVKKNGRRKKPCSDSEFRDLLKKEMYLRRHPERVAKLREWAGNKHGVDLDTLIRSATTVTRRRYLDKECVVFIGTTINKKITGLQYAPVDGSKFPAFRSQGPKKTLNRKGSKDGWIIPLGTAAAKDAAIIVLCEGPGDAFSVQRLLPEGTVAVTNLCGAGSLPNDLAWLKGKEVVVIYDPDAAGQEGGSKACRQLATLASVRNVRLQNGDKDDDDQEG